MKNKEGIFMILFVIVWFSLPYISVKIGQYFGFEPMIIFIPLVIISVVLLGNRINAYS